MTIEISMNGERVRTEAVTLQALLLARGYKVDTAFACAVNNTFVPRHQWPERLVAERDRIDIVTPITGG